MKKYIKPIIVIFVILTIVKGWCIFSDGFPRPSLVLQKLAFPSTYKQEGQDVWGYNYRYYSYKDYRLIASCGLNHAFNSSLHDSIPEPGFAGDDDIVAVYRNNSLIRIDYACACMYHDKKITHAIYHFIDDLFVLGKLGTAGLSKNPAGGPCGQF